MEHRYGGVSTESNNRVQSNIFAKWRHMATNTAVKQRGWWRHSARISCLYWQTAWHFKTRCSLHRTCAPWLWVILGNIFTNRFKSTTLLRCYWRRLIQGLTWIHPSTQGQFGEGILSEISLSNNYFLQKDTQPNGIINLILTVPLPLPSLNLL